MTPKDISELDEPVFANPPEAITESGYRSASTRLLPAGSILFSSRAPIGLVAIAGRPMCTNQGFKSLIPGPDVDSRFLYHAIKRHVSRIQAMGNGATFKEVSKEVMERVEVALPKDVREQRRIAAILDKADAIRRKRRQALAETDTLLRSVFLDMFGDPNDAIGASKCVPLASLIDPMRPITYGILMPGPDFPDGVPYVRVVDMQRGEIQTSSIRRTSAMIAQEYRRSQLKAGDVLLSIRGHAGRTAIVPGVLHGANITQDSARLAPADKNEAEFIAAYISSKAVQNWIRQRTKGGAVKGINLGDVKMLPVPAVSQSLRRRFSQCARELRQLSRDLKEQLSASEELFACVSQRAFRGEL